MAHTIKKVIIDYLRTSLMARVVMVNVMVFVVLRVVTLSLFLFTGNSYENEVCHWVELPSNTALLGSHWWGFITYMFSQYDLWHLVFNMLWLWWFAKIFITISTEREAFALYIYGGIAGALTFIAGFNLLPAFVNIQAWLIGSSAAVLAIVVAAAIFMPNLPINFFFVSIKLKWLAIITIAIDVIGMTGANSGGHMAHLGGVAIGVIYALLCRRGIMITRPLNFIIDLVSNFYGRIFHPHQAYVKYNINIPRWSKRKEKKRTSKSNSKQEAHDHTHTSQESKSRAQDTAELDEILDKIKKSGYAGLTPDERKRLFEVSSRIKTD